MEPLCSCSLWYVRHGSMQITAQRKCIFC
jgi:hypothetical protein